MVKMLGGLGLALFCATAFAADNSHLLNVSVSEQPALKLQLPEGWSSKSKNETTELSSPLEVHVQLWNVPNAKSVKESLPRVGEIITGEVIDFKVVEAKDITVAGAAAEHIIGTGTEADDGDPSNVEVFLFSVGRNVFLVCAHGEGKGATKARSAILAMLATATKP